MLDTNLAPDELVIQDADAPVSTTPAADTRLAPVAPGQRILTIDILRGFALFGILLVNMQLFNNSFLAMIGGLIEPETPLDQWAYRFILFLGEGKFYSIFAFLFGLGMTIQYYRAERRGSRFGPFWLRRMAVLFVIGLIHAYLIWVGDILILYSLLGMALLLWRKARPRTVMIWVVIFLLLPLGIYGVLLGLFNLGAATAGEGAMSQIVTEQMELYHTLAVAADQVYATGSFWQVTVQRANDMNWVYGTLPFIAFNVLAAMLLGVYAGKRRIFDNLGAHMPLIRRVWLWGLVVGLVGNFIYVYFGEQSSRNVPSPQVILSLAGQTFGAPALALFYMSTLALLAERVAWRRRLAPLACVGRMALTNYLLQSIICTTLFYGYGLGLYGQLGMAAGVVLTVVIYTLQVLFSLWWLRYYRFGPMEWLWRTLAYGKRQPMRVGTE